MPARPSIPFLLDLLRLAMRREATALYVVPWMPPTLRIGERTVPLSSAAFTPEQSTRLVLDLLDDERRAALDRSREIAFDLMLDGIGRFRVHAFRRHGQPAMAVRPFTLEVPTPHTLALPTEACQAVMGTRGLLVLAGPSAALRRDATAALLEHRNRHGSGDLALLDGASRSWLDPARCHLHQGLDPAALDTLLQRRAQAPAPPEPLAIAWGELRDGPQLDRVLHAASDALCLVTLPATQLAGALQRLVALAAEHTGPALLHRAAIALHAVLLLRPVPARDGTRDLAATQRLMHSPELAATLALGDLDTVRGWLAGGAVPPGAVPPSGPDDHLAQLLAQGLVSPEVAVAHAADAAAMARRIAAGMPPPPAPPAASPMAVDTGFGDVFATGALPADAFAFADTGAPAAAADTQFDDVDWSAGATPSRPWPRDPPAAAAGRPSPQAAQFSVWMPPAVAAGAEAAIDVWVARADQADRIAPLAQADSDPTPDATPPLDAPLTLQLHIDGVLPSPRVVHGRWTGAPQRLRLRVPVAARVTAGAHAARIGLQVGGLSIGELGFVLPVRPDAVAAPAEDAQAVRRTVASAYASFDPQDLAAVQQAVALLHRVVPELEVFMGAPQLRGTEGWRARTGQALAGRERLYLFWSRAAAESPWVDFEWRQVLRHRGPDAIDIVRLHPPHEAPLPHELAEPGVTQVPTARAG